MRSFLVTDFGIAQTRTVLIDVVEGEYRLIAASLTRSTTTDNVIFGMIRNMEQIQRQIGRALWADGMLTSQTDGSGFDEFLATASSAGRPLRAVLIGLMNDFSLASARRALTGTYVEVIQVLSMADPRSEQQRINALLRDQPDMILMVGGTNDGNEESVRAMLQVVETATKLVPAEFRPIVLYAGNERLRPYVRARFGHTVVLTADNVRPSIEEEHLTSAKAQLQRVFDSFLRRQPGGFGDISQASITGITPTAQSAARVVRYLDALQGAGRGVLYLDIGSGTSTLISSLDDLTTSDIRSQLGMGFHAQEALQNIDWRDIERWLPFGFSLEAFEEWAYNKALAPSTVPQTLYETFIELAVTREIARLLLADARTRWKEAGYRKATASLVIAAGATLTGLPPRLAAMMLLDALEPSGVVEVWADPFNLASALGIIGERESSAVVQVVDRGGFPKLGTAFCPSGRPRGLRSRMKIKLTFPDGKVLEKQLSPGDLWMPDLAPGLWLDVDIRLPRGYNLNGKRRYTNRLQTGAVGFIFDLRGRPLHFTSGRKRRVRMADWYSHAAGINVDIEALEAESIALSEGLTMQGMNIKEEDFPNYSALPAGSLDADLAELLASDPMPLPEAPEADGFPQDLDDPFESSNVRATRKATSNPSDLDDLRKGLGL